ncbi:MAG: methionyl-tRNA formyltransferase [Armatimonadota bacterium]|nr:methionyl-tRNA formyltransferase [Armatimonadota bacterium]
MGTPELAIASLDALRAEHEIALVVTQPDKPARHGHKLELTAPPVKRRALELGIPVSQPNRARDEAFIADLRAVAPEAIAVVAYGQILPRAILELPPRGCINLHFSLLPRWRGAAPVQYAILAGDTVTGVTTQWMAEKLDSGDIILQREVAIQPEETAGELLERLTPLGAEILRDTMRLVQQGTAPRLPQDESRVTLAPTIKKEDGRIDWSQSATSIVNRVRAMTPWPGAWCEFHGQPLKIWWASVPDLPSPAQQATPGTVLAVTGDGITVATGDAPLQLREVQAAGKPRMDAAAWARGARIAVGEQFD